MATGNDTAGEVVYFPLSSRVRIHLLQEPTLELPLHLEEEVERIWAQQKERHNLSNSLLFSLTAHEEEKLFGQFVEYRHFIACQHCDELQELLNIYPLGVSGLCFCNDHLLIGTRDSKLAQYGGYLECVPSGSIEARAFSQGEVDFFMQFVWELAEEAHIGEKMIKEIHPIGLFYSPESGVYDIGLHVRLDIQEHEMRLDGSAEYPLLEWLSTDDWEKLLEQEEAKIVPLSKTLWRAWHRQHDQRQD